MKTLKWPHDKTNEMACVPSEDSDQPGHLPSLIRVFAVCMKKAWVLSYPLNAQWKFWSDWVDAQGDLNLCCSHKSSCRFCHVLAHISLGKKQWVYRINPKYWERLARINNVEPNQMPGVSSWSTLFSIHPATCRYINTQWLRATQSIRTSQLLTIFVLKFEQV